MTKIKALLLAGGYGTRLRPITYTIPKCLVNIGNIPLLGHWLQLLDKADCNEAIINTHYLRDKVSRFLTAQTYCKFPIKEFYEETLLGTAGTLIANKEVFADSIGLLIHADNVISFEIRELINAHLARPDNCVLTMATFTTEKPSECGIVTCDENNVVQKFHEKEKSPPGNKANGAIYVFGSDFLSELVAMGPNVNDFSTQVLPNFLGRIFAWHTNKPFLDIGTPDNLGKAQRIWHASAAESL